MKDWDYLTIGFFLGGFVMIVLGLILIYISNFPPPS